MRAAHDFRPHSLWHLAVWPPKIMRETSKQFRMTCSPGHPLRGALGCPRLAHFTCRMDLCPSLWVVAPGLSPQWLERRRRPPLRDFEYAVASRLRWLAPPEGTDCCAAGASWRSQGNRLARTQRLLNSWRFPGVDAGRTPAIPGLHKVHEDKWARKQV